MIVSENSLKVNYCNLYDFFNDIEIGIPIFQRFYAWKATQIIQMENDILEIIRDKTKQLYLLDFIYYKDGNKIMLADGQQRIVTINNLIKAIKDVAELKEISIPEINYFNITYDIVANNKKYQNHFFKYPAAPFKIVYMKLREFVENNIDKIDDMIYIIKNNLYVYIKECNNADDAFDIFQQINTGGKPLTKDEVIKTSLDQFSDIYGIKFDTSKMKDVHQSITSYYKFKTNNSDTKFDNMAIMTFLKDYVTKDATTFQEFVNAIALLDKVSKSPIKYVINYINRATLHDIINILTMQGIDLTTNKNYLTKLLMPLCMMSITLSLNNSTPTAFRYLLNDVVKKIKNKDNVDDINFFLIKYINDDPTTWKIPFESFKEKLGDSTISKGIKKGLLILDIIDKNVSGTVTVSLTNLEHIYPQKPDIEWARYGWPTSQEDQKRIIDNIGNYLLLCESVNKSISNQYITKKIASYNTIIAKDKILQTEINTVDFGKFESEREVYIKNRQYEIATRIRDTLPLGKVLIN